MILLIGKIVTAGANYTTLPNSASATFDKIVRSVKPNFPSNARSPARMSSMVGVVTVSEEG